MSKKKRWPVLVLAAALVLAAMLLLTGCESSGEYEGDNVTVQFGNSNTTVEVQAE